MLEYIKSFGITVHENLSISKSSVGGTGLFLSEMDLSDDLIVLRIPGKAVLDYTILLDVLNEVKAYEKEVEERITTDPSDVVHEASGLSRNPISESQMIVGMLKTCQPETETQILICYLAAFVALRNLSRSFDYSKSPLRRYDAYLDVLTRTYVCDFPEKPQQDPFLQRLIQIAESHKDEYDELIVLLGQELALDVKQYLSFEEYYQVVQVVKSRTLEIPHKMGDEEDDYTVNVTLVPVLDFANHDFDNNSYFDVDKQTGDILLKVCAETKLPQELTISYSPVRDIQYFVQNYGFVPRDGRILEERVDLSRYVEDFDALRKWMGIAPYVKLVKTDRVYLDIHENALSVLFSGRYAYNPNWASLLKQEYPEHADEIIAQVEWQQNSAHIDAIVGVPSYGVIEKDVNSNTREIGDGELNDKIDMAEGYEDTKRSEEKNILGSLIKAVVGQVNYYQGTTGAGFEKLANEYLDTRKSFWKSVESSFDPHDPHALIISQSNDTLDLS